MQMIRMDDNLNVTVGQGEWSDKIGAGALGWFIAWPLAVTAGVGAYKQKKLPEEIFQVIEQCIVSGGRSVVVRNAGAELNAGMVVCPACKTQCAAGAKFCNNCGAKLENKCPQCGAEIPPEAASAEHAEHRFPRRALRCDKGRRLRMRREKTAGAAKRRMAFQYAAGGMPDDRGPSPVRFGGGEYVPGNPRWSGYQNQVQWGRPAGAASGDSFEYEAQLLLGDDVVESKAVEIDTYLFFTNDVVTRPQEEYTIRVRARWIMIVGDPDGQYMVADVGEAEPPHEHSYTQKHDAAQHWQECSCGERLNVANHIYGDRRETKPATETEAGSRERDCTVCDYVQTETIPMLEHEHSYGDWQKDETQHWKECRCGEKTEVGNHTFDDWTITKEPTTTETGSRERGCAVCEYVQTEAIPAAGTGSPQTGDSSDMALWIGLMLASCGGVLGMLFYRRKKAVAGK